LSAQVNSSPLGKNETDRRPIRIYPRPAIERNGWIRHGACVEGLPDGDAELWFDCEPRHAGLLTSRADPWPLALLFAAMQHGSTLAVDGEVSRDLLTNLEMFQETWRLWVPDRYRPVALQAASEVAGPARPSGDTDLAVMIFGGGIADCITAVRHARRLAGRQTLTLRAGLMVLGRPTSGGEAAALPLDDARALLGDLGLDLWTIRTNAALFAPVWEHASGALLASCLHWFSGGLAAGVLAATGSLTELTARSGSHPLTDPWLGSDRMRIVHDGAEHDLARKAEIVATWPETARRFRRGSGPPPHAASSRPTPFVWARPPRASEIHVFPEPAALESGRGVLAARVEGLGAGPRTVRFSVEARHTPHLTSLADPFACALLFPAMRSGAPLVIHGPVSRALLRNLEQLQQVWHAWAPRYVTPIVMRADQEVDGVSSSGDTLILFSGGVDSSFSVYRHHRGLVGRRSRRITAGLMVLGFDIPHTEEGEFRAAFENSRRMLDSLGIDLWSMETNLRNVLADWEPGHGTAIAASVHCFAGRISTALVAAQGTAASLSTPWGTHPLTDRLLSSDRLRVVTDGEDTGGRLDKVALVAEWPAAMRGLRVCFVSRRRDRNCGKCSKCVRTSLAFLANGLPLPATLPLPGPERVSRLPLRAAWEARQIRELLARASAAGVANRPEILALSECLRWNEARWTASETPEERIPRWRRVWSRLAHALRQWAS
jgi:hypothetical protein